MKNLLTALASAILLVPAALHAADKPLCGAYSQSETTPEVRAAAQFAIEAQSVRTSSPLVLAEIVKAQKQVVAGMNYRLELMVKDGDKTTRAEAVVWKKLDGTMQLTEWNWIIK